MGEDKPKYDLPDTIDENKKRRDIVGKEIDRGRQQVKEMETYRDQLQRDHDTRLVPEERKRQAERDQGFGV